ncbi:hypothetical protein Tco_0381838 [Tanacetum coccineum]
MSNTNNNLRTQTSNALHNAIMKAGGKDHPPMLALGIDNDIYSTVDACPNTCEMWKAIERLKQGESINVQDLETNLYWEFGKFTSRDGESLESYYSRSQQAATRNRGKSIVNSPLPSYDQEPKTVAKDDALYMGMYSRNVWKPKLSTRMNFHKEKMLLCKQEEAGVQLNAEQADWKDDTEVNLTIRKRKRHYMYMARSDAYFRLLLNFWTYLMLRLLQKNRMVRLDTDELLKKAISDKLKTNQLMFKDLKKFQAELDRYHDVNYASKEAIDCAKAKESSKEANPRLNYYYAVHMKAILGVYTTLGEFTDLQCDYLDQVVKCEHLEKELSISNTMSKSFEALQQHVIDLELALQQC